MRVWVVKIGEPLPADGANVRLYRAGVLAETLAQQGADVTWWSAAFNHQDKTHRVDAHTTVTLPGGGRLKLLASCGYAKNVSLARVRDHRQVARAFSQLAPAEARPDIIVAAMPTPGLCQAAVDYGRSHRVPVLLDLRDKWPDVFLDLLPHSLRWAGRMALHLAFHQTADVCRRATGLIGVTESYLNWGLRCAGRNRGLHDAVIPIGFRRRRQSDELLKEARTYWDAAGVPEDDRAVTVCFFGTIGRQFALQSAIEAARRLHREGRSVRLVLCGKGDFLDHYRREARDLPNIVLPGWVDAAKIEALMERSQLGLAPYRSTENFAGHIPNKPAEYLSAGLPVVSSLGGELADLLVEYGCGWTYAESDAGQLADILRAFARRSGGWKGASDGALRLYNDRFDADKIYPAYAEHLAGVVRGHHPGLRRAA